MSIISFKKAQIIKGIEENVIRAGIVDGVYSSAIFTYGKNTFTVTADVYDKAGNRTGSCITKNGKVYGGSIVSNGRYRNITLYGSDSLMEHQLLAICLIPGATAKLLADGENNVINHKTIALASVDFRKRKHEYDLQCEMYYWGGAEPDESLIENPYIPPCDVRDLEICTSSQNYAHGAFINTFDLYDIPVSAKDVPLLKQCLINEKQVAYIMNLYMNHGADVMISMLRGC